MDINIHNEVLTIRLDRKVDYSISFSLNDFFFKTIKHPFKIVELDFRDCTYCTLAGAMFLSFMTSELTKSKELNILPIESRISNCPENLFVVLASFGLFRSLISNSNLRISAVAKEINDEKIEFWTKTVKKQVGGMNALYWPITLIPMKTIESFEADLSSLINNFTTYFHLLISNGLLEGLNEENGNFIRKYFISAVNEAIKNVWDHSESRGIASIHSSRANKTTFCLFDYGIGFIGSYIKRKGNFDRNRANDIEKLSWLFKEGNTSNSLNNHGRGLARIAKFTDLLKGILVICTDKYILHYTLEKGLKISEKPFYPGTQIMINF